MNNTIPQHVYKKKCTKCEEWLPFTDFGPDRTSSDGLFCWCHPCRRKIRKETTTTKQTRDRNYRRLYNITAKQYDQMLAEQCGLCAICKQPETAKSRSGEIKPLAVDHDHETNEVRRLLCHNCNIILGVIEVNLDRLDNFMGYLEEMKNRGPSVKIVQLRLVE